MIKNIDQILKSQKEFFRSGATFSVGFRIYMLKKLYNVIKDKEEDIERALMADLGKSPNESFMCEIGQVLSEITYMLKHIQKYTGKQKVPTPITQFPGKSYKQAIPYGNVLIMSPWNYPVLLTLSPLVNAIAAGNTAVIKPSAYAPASADIVAEIIAETFPSRYVAVVKGGREENQMLLKKKWDMVFFTGSTTVGKEVLRHTAEHLTPTVLELGGKSPCIVDSSAKIALAAKRIVFGKFLNCGQTCVAPDYILCHELVKYELIAELQKQIRAQYGLIPIDNPQYGKMINQKHFDRVMRLIDQDKVVFGGNYNEKTLKISPTIMENVTWDDPIMQEEIFGPVLPIITYKKFDEIIPMLADKSKPLALYLFTKDKEHIKRITERVSYGGGCINDTVIHLATSEMGFGGVGESGMGSYHGKAGFDAFSHTKSIVERNGGFDISARYAPYSDSAKKLLEKFLK